MAQSSIDFLFPCFTPLPERHGHKSVDEWLVNSKDIPQSHGRKSVVTGFALNLKFIKKVLNSTFSVVLQNNSLQHRLEEMSRKNGVLLAVGLVVVALGAAVASQLS